MFWPFHHKAVANYWLTVFALYALAEACIQLLFHFVLNNFGNQPISLIEIHFLMWFFQCIMIWPIWWVARLVYKQKVIVQILVNLGFYLLYSYIWFGPVQDVIGFLYHHLIQVTRSESERIPAILDQGNSFSYLNYQLLKHAFRLSWFYLANYFFNYHLENKKRLELAVANKELQLKMLKWHLNPSFYFKTISHLGKIAAEKPINTSGPILQLAKVMEYVIYEAKEKLIDVKKEIQFIRNYIQLINGQPGNNAIFEIETAGEYDHLKIAPLLLVGFIDKMLANTTRTGEKLYRIQLLFNGNKMQLNVDGYFESKEGLLLTVDDALYRQLKEWYPDRFTITGNTNDDTPFTISIKLDEER
ncbi:MAG: histidine kinase [Bacteroidota bacterium]